MILLKIGKFIRRLVFAGKSDVMRNTLALMEIVGIIHIV